MGPVLRLRSEYSSGDARLGTMTTLDFQCNKAPQGRYYSGIFLIMGSANERRRYVPLYDFISRMMLFLQVTSVNAMMAMLLPRVTGMTDLTVSLWVLYAPQRARDAIITPLWRQNDVATSLWRHNDVVIASCVRWIKICLYKVYWRTVDFVITGNEDCCYDSRRYEEQNYHQGNSRVWVEIFTYYFTNCFVNGSSLDAPSF